MPTCDICSFSFDYREQMEISFISSQKNSAKKRILTQLIIFPLKKEFLSKTDVNIDESDASNNLILFKISQPSVDPMIIEITMKNTNWRQYCGFAAMSGTHSRFLRFLLLSAEKKHPAPCNDDTPQWAPESNWRESPCLKINWISLSLLPWLLWRASCRNLW